MLYRNRGIRAIGLKLFRSYFMGSGHYEEFTIPRPAARAPRIGYRSAKRGAVRKPDHAVTLLLVPRVALPPRVPVI